MLKSTACASNDPHVIKLVYSAWQEQLAYGNTQYATAAAIKLGLL